jgi:hypothetical protein
VKARDAVEATLTAAQRADMMARVRDWQSQN